MKKALVFGAGNIGRGFIGEIFTKSGFAVTFADVNRQVIQSLNRLGEYPLVLVEDDVETAQTIGGVDAIDMADAQAVSQAVASCELMATAVGVANLARIAPVLAQGLALRIQAGAPPVNILVCENKIGANRILCQEVRGHLPQDMACALDERVGFVEVSIGRMVPASARDERNPLAVRTEPYAKLPYDATCWRGAPIDLYGGIPSDGFAYQIRHKLFIHNLGHATAGYLGFCKDLHFIHEAARDDAIRKVTQAAMLQSARALSQEFPKESAAIEEDVRLLLHRFGNTALRDPIARVCADPLRKLSPDDRLVGALRNCHEQDVPCPDIIAGIAAALLFDAQDDPSAQAMQARIRDEGTAGFLQAHCGLAADLGFALLPVQAAHAALKAMRL